MRESPYLASISGLSSFRASVKRTPHDVKTVGRRRKIALFPSALPGERSNSTQKNCVYIANELTASYSLRNPYGAFSLLFGESADQYSHSNEVNKRSAFAFDRMGVVELHAPWLSVNVPSIVVAQRGPHIRPNQAHSCPSFFPYLCSRSTLRGAGLFFGHPCLCLSIIKLCCTFENVCATAQAVR